MTSVSYVQSVPLGEAIEIDAITNQTSKTSDLSALFVNDTLCPKLPSFRKYSYNLDTYEKNDTWLGTDQDFLLFVRERLLANNRVIFSFLCTSINKFVFFIFGSISELDLSCFHPNERPSNNNNNNTTYYSGWCSLVPETYYRPVLLQSLMQFIDDLLIVHYLDIHHTKPLHQFAWVSTNTACSGTEIVTGTGDTKEATTVTYTRFWFWDMQVLFIAPKFIFLFYEDDYVRNRTVQTQNNTNTPLHSLQQCTQYSHNKYSIAVYYYELPPGDVVERVVPIHTPTMFLFFEKYARHLFDVYNKLVTMNHDDNDNNDDDDL